MADGRWQKKERTSGKKGVIEADLVSGVRNQEPGESNFHPLIVRTTHGVCLEQSS
jgi:glycerol-3-phosphate responsive antiterminator